MFEQGAQIAGARLERPYKTYHFGPGNKLEQAGNVEIC